MTIEYSLIEGLPSTLGVNNLDGTNPANNPRFVNPANGDYRIMKGSPCIDKGNMMNLTTYNGLMLSKLNGKDLAGNRNVHRKFLLQDRYVWKQLIRLFMILPKITNAKNIYMIINNLIFYFLMDTIRKI